MYMRITPINDTALVITIMFGLIFYYKCLRKHKAPTFIFPIVSIIIMTAMGMFFIDETMFIFELGVLSMISLFSVMCWKTKDEVVDGANVSFSLFSIFSFVVIFLSLIFRIFARYGAGYILPAFLIVITSTLIAIPCKRIDELIPKSNN